MAVQKYDIRKPDGTFEVRYWSPLNKPVLNSRNEISYIIHKVEDVTEFVLMKNEKLVKDKFTEDLLKKVEKMEIDIFSRAAEIHRLNSDLEKKIEERTEELSKSEKKYKTLFQNNPMVMWVVDLETCKFLDVNEAAINNYGYSREEFLSMTTLDIRPEEDKQKFVDFINVSKPQDNHSGIWRHCKKNGSLIYVEKKSDIILFNGLKACLVLANDVTERLNSEADKAKLSSHIEKRNKELEQFAYIVSHNLRAPVANIIGFAEELSLELYTKEEKDLFLLEILSAVKRLDEVIVDLNYIFYSKQEINENMIEINLSELVSQIKSAIIGTIDREKVVIITDFHREKMIHSVKSYLHSIFLNLIINSIKYKQADKAPVINISSRRSNGKIILTFKDNGMGIDLAKKGGQVFGLYKRFHTGIEGKGMGLFMVKSQVESLGGQINIKSVLDSGTEFEIELPDKNSL